MTLSFAPDAIETWPLARLQPYERNAKTHGADQVARIAASMAEFGWTVPVLVADDGELIAGHGRILAAERLGLTEAPVIVLGHLTEAQRRAYRIADNRLAESPWDEALLAGELPELAADDFDLSLVGFSDAELDQLLAFDAGDEGDDGEDVPKAPEVPDTVEEVGDLIVVTSIQSEPIASPAHAGAGTGTNLASLRRFWAVAASWNCSVAPLGPRSRIIRSPMYRFRWAKSISTFRLCMNEVM